MKITTGILLANLGTPSAPTPTAVRNYLAEFLSDPRVIQLPTWLWQPILRGIILRIRPQRSAKAYKKIWTAEGSPLLAISKAQAAKLQTLYDAKNIPIKVALGMRYGQPSLVDALYELKKSGVNKLLILPLYPQYARASTASIFDTVDAALKNLNFAAEIHKINNYATHPDYINAIANSMKNFWQTHIPGEKLLFSFHGLPKNSIAQGDPYYSMCLTTANLVAKQLALPQERWQVVFQSRFGLQEWLQPYCDKTLIALGKQGSSVDVVCPGFAADCLETLEEISMQNKAKFLHAGGKEFNYIPALNASTEHIQMLFNLLQGQP